MAKLIILPKFGNTVEECTLLKWKKLPGDAVYAGEPICEVETDKTSMDIESPDDGVLRHIFCAEGDVVAVLHPVAIVGSADEDISSLQSAGQEADSAGEYDYSADDADDVPKTPTAAPAAERAAEHAAEHTAAPAAEHSAERAAEHAAEHTAVPAAEHSAERAAEHAAEHTAAPAAEHSAEHSKAQGGSTYIRDASASEPRSTADTADEQKSTLYFSPRARRYLAARNLTVDEFLRIYPFREFYVAVSQFRVEERDLKKYFQQDVRTSRAAQEYLLRSGARHPIFGTGPDGKVLSSDLVFATSENKEMHGSKITPMVRNPLASQSPQAPEPPAVQSTDSAATTARRTASAAGEQAVQDSDSGATTARSDVPAGAAQRSTAAATGGSAASAAAPQSPHSVIETPSPSSAAASPSSTGTPSQPPLTPSNERVLQGKELARAQHMLESLQQSAQVTMTMSANAQRILALCTQYARQGVSVLLDDMLLFLCSRVLARHGWANSHFLDAWRIIEFASVSLAFIDADAKVCTVIQNADTKSLSAINAERIEAQHHGDGRDIDGKEATFTLMKLGTMHFSTPLLMLPQTGILGIGSIVPAPVYSAGTTITMQPHLQLSFTFDHRAYDGAAAASFLQDFAKSIADPESTELKEENSGSKADL